MKNKYQRFIAFIALSGLTVLLSAFLLTLLGIVDLHIVNEIEVSDTTDFVLKFAMFMLNMYFVFSIVLGEYSYKIYLYLLAYIPLYVVTHYIMYETNLVVSAFIPLVYLFCIKPKTKTIYKYLLFSFIIIIYQSITGVIKVYGFSYSLMVSKRNVFLAIVYSIDLYLFYILILKVVKTYELGLELVVSTEERSVQQNSSGIKEVLEENADMTGRQQAVFIALAMCYQLFQLLVVLSIGTINNMLAELLVMLVMFWIGRKILVQSWHSEKLNICSMATFTGFYILTKIALPFEVSLFSVVALSTMFIWIMHQLGIEQEDKEITKERLSVLEKRYDEDFTKYGLTAEMAKFAYDYKISNLTIKQQMEKTGLTEQVVKNYRSKVNKAMKVTF